MSSKQRNHNGNPQDSEHTTRYIFEKVICILLNGDHLPPPKVGTYSKFRSEIRDIDKGMLKVNKHGIHYEGKNNTFGIPPHNIKNFEKVLKKKLEIIKLIDSQNNGYAFWGKGIRTKTHNKNTREIFNAIKEWDNVWKTFPDLEIEVDDIDLRPDDWVNGGITFSNTGNIDAYNIQVKSTGDIDIRQESSIERLEAGEKKEGKLYLKGGTSGKNVPVDLQISYQNQYGKNKTLERTVWVETNRGKNSAQKKVKKVEEDKGNNKSYTTLAEIKSKISQLREEEEMIDVRAIESALEENDVERAGELLVKLEEKYEEYTETVEELKSVDSDLSTLSEKLARGEIDNDAFKSAKEGLETKKYDLEEKLNQLRQEVIHEDYEKPF